MRIFRVTQTFRNFNKQKPRIICAKDPDEARKIYQELVDDSNVHLRCEDVKEPCMILSSSDDPDEVHCPVELRSPTHGSLMNMN